MSLPFEALVTLATQLVGSQPGIFVAPSIPPRKERNARAVHAASLPADEPIAVLFDDTVFGGGDDGYVVTTNRLCWRNYTEQPQMLPWGEIRHIDLTDPVLNGLRIKSTSSKDATLVASLQLFRRLAISATSSGSATLQALSTEPCRMCGGGEHLYFSKDFLVGQTPFPFEALVCRACRYTHLFNIHAPLEAGRSHQIFKATPRGPYR